MADHVDGAIRGECHLPLITRRGRRVDAHQGARRAVAHQRGRVEIADQADDVRCLGGVHQSGSVDAEPTPGVGSGGIERGDRTACRIHLPDGTGVVDIPHQQVARGRPGEPGRSVETGGGAHAIHKASCAIAGERAYHAAFDFPNLVVLPISDIQHARGTDGDARWPVEGGRSGGAIHGARRSRARHRGHDTRGRDHADAMVAFVRHIDVVGAVDGQADRTTEPGRRARAVGEASRARGTGESGHHALWRDLADPLIFRNEQVALAVADNPVGIREGGRGAGTVSAARRAGR